MVATGVYRAVEPDEWEQLPYSVRSHNIFACTLSDIVSGMRCSRPVTLPSHCVGLHAWSPSLQSFVNAIRKGRARDVEALLKVGAVDGTSGMSSLRLEHRSSAPALVGYSAARAATSVHFLSK